MPIDVTCSCGRQLRLKDSLKGKRIKCPECTGIVSVPLKKPTTEIRQPKPQPQKRRRKPRTPAVVPANYDDTFEQALPPVRKRKKKRRKQSRFPLGTLLAIAFVVAMISGIGFVGYRYLPGIIAGIRGEIQNPKTEQIGPFTVQLPESATRQKRSGGSIDLDGVVVGTKTVQFWDAPAKIFFSHYRYNGKRNPAYPDFDSCLNARTPREAIDTIRLFEMKDDRIASHHWQAIRDVQIDGRSFATRDYILRFIDGKTFYGRLYCYRDGLEQIICGCTADSYNSRDMRLFDNVCQSLRLAK